MKVLNKKTLHGYILYTLLLDNNTTTTVSIVDDNRDEKEIMKDIRILTKNTVGEPFVGTTDIEDYAFEDSKPTLMYVDFNNLTGEVYDQYAELMEVPIVFSIDSEVASIQDNKIIEKEVAEPTSYFIVAKVEDLEQRQERHIYPKPTPQPSEVDLLEAKLKASSERQDFLEELIAEMAMEVYP